MKYELVALFDSETYPVIEQLQKNICRKYRLYKNTHQLYIPIGTIYDPEINKLDTVVTKVLQPYKKFKVKINNNIALNNQNKQVNVQIDDKGYIIRISRNINETLNLNGFNMNTSEYWHLFVPLASSNYNIKKACGNNSIPFNRSLLKNDYLNFAKIDRIELWKIIGNRKDTVIKSFPLRKY